MCLAIWEEPTQIFAQCLCESGREYYALRGNQAILAGKAESMNLAPKKKKKKLK